MALFHIDPSMIENERFTVTPSKPSESGPEVSDKVEDPVPMIGPPIAVPANVDKATKTVATPALIVRDIYCSDEVTVVRYSMKPE